MNREPTDDQPSWNGEYDPQRYDPEEDNDNCLDCGTELKRQSKILYCPNCYLIVKNGM